MGASRAPRLARWLALVASAHLLLVAVRSPAAWAAPADDIAPAGAPGDQIDARLARYMEELARSGVASAPGNLDTLRVDLKRAEQLMAEGSFEQAALELYAVVHAPRYDALAEYVEFENAEYDLGVALLRAGADDTALATFFHLLAGPPSGAYWLPSQRRIVDLMIAMRDFAGGAARFDAATAGMPIPASAAAELAYLHGRAAFEAGDLSKAETSFGTVDKKSRLYSSAVYFRGVIATRRGDLKAAAAAMCIAAEMGDRSKAALRIDDRYYTVKDLARLALGRIAHEAGEYDDAYYHYFQIPDDSKYLADALFEAAWSMYQQRNLEAARDLVHEFLATFPDSARWPEATLLAGYIELAACKFSSAEHVYADLEARLAPVLRELDAIRADPERRAELLAHALDRSRRARQDAVGATTLSPFQEVLRLLELDPAFVRLNDTVTGMVALRGRIPGVEHTWKSLAERDAKIVVRTAGEAASTDDTPADLADDIDRLQGEIRRQRRALRGADSVTAGVEQQRLADLTDRLGELQGAAMRLASESGDDASGTAPSAPKLAPLIAEDRAAMRTLDARTRELQARLAAAADAAATQAIETLAIGLHRVSDRARLGAVDSIIGQKRALDAEIEGLAEGRTPPEIVKRKATVSSIRDDEEYWPFEGEYWRDEYKGWK